MRVVCLGGMYDVKGPYLHSQQAVGKWVEVVLSTGEIEGVGRSTPKGAGGTLLGHCRLTFVQLH